MTNMTTKQKNIVKRWVAALRSGEYRKGTGALRTKGKTRDSFCCLGVLCDLAVKAKVIKAPEDGDEVGDYFSYNNETDILPAVVRDWAGLLDYAGAGAFTREKTGEGLDLIELNDGSDISDVKPQSFAKIADLIEKHLATDAKTTADPADRLFV